MADHKQGDMIDAIRAAKREAKQGRSKYNKPMNSLTQNILDSCQDEIIPEEEKEPPKREHTINPRLKFNLFPGNYPKDYKLLLKDIFKVKLFTD